MKIKKVLLLFGVITLVAASYWAYIILNPQEKREADLKTVMASRDDLDNLVKFVLSLVFNSGSRFVWGWVVRSTIFVYLIGVFFESMVLFKESKKK